MQGLQVADLNAQTGIRQLAALQCNQATILIEHFQHARHPGAGERHANRNPMRLSRHQTMRIGKGNRHTSILINGDTDPR